MKSSKHPLSLVFPTFFGIDEASRRTMVPMLCLHWAQFVAKLPRKGFKLRHVGHESAYMCIAWLQVRIHFTTFFGFDGGSYWAMFPTLGLRWAQLAQHCPYAGHNCVMLDPICAKRPSCGMLDPSWAEVGGQVVQVRRKLGASWAQVGSLDPT